MPPPDNGNEYISFARLIALEPISSDVYRSKALAFGPAQGNRTYGGHVYMQACYAAAQTVAKGMVLHVSTWSYSVLGVRAGAIPRSRAVSQGKRSPDYHDIC